MSRDRHAWPGAEGCPLERWRARFITYALGALALACFALIGFVVMRGPLP